MLSEAIDTFPVIERLKSLADGIAISTLDSNWAEFTGGLLKQFTAC